MLNKKNKTSLPSLFLSQSLTDAWEDYTRALTRETFPCWDYIILTASNDHQAEGFRKQLTQRQATGALPPRTAFHVIPDPEGKRVGSGGATLNVLRFLARESGTEDFKSLRILVIHSGGDSRRVPQYSALGKLFSPVPRLLPDGRPSTLFDEFLIAMSGVPGRIREGMLLLSGDVLLLFNPLQIDFAGEGAAALSFKADVETGRNHGVYLRGEGDNVVEFLHKQTVETLQARGAVNSRGCVDIDTGAVLFSLGILQALYGLVKTEPERFINEKVRLSLYGDFQYPMASGSTLEKFFLEKPEGEFCPELEEARKAVWEALHPFRMKLLRLAPAKFIHFGTTHEILSLMAAGVEDYTGLGWARSISSSIKEGAAAGYMSVLSSGAECGEGVYLEVSSVGPGSRVGSHSILSFVDISGETIPEDVVLHALKRRDGKFVARIYGTGDNPKAGRGGTFLGGSLDGFMRENGLTESDLWDSREHTLWTARLYPACSNIREAVKAALNVYAMACGQGDTAAWRAGERTSLQAGFQDADPDALIAWEKRMGELVQMDALEKLIFAGRPVSDARGLLSGGKLTAIQREWMEGRLAQAGYGERMRLNYYVGKTLGGAEGERYIGHCFQAIQESVLGTVPAQQKEGIPQRIAQKECIVKLPLRLNWGGGWSDTPPYCYENGGTVLNAAVLLKGERPVTVRLTALEEKKVILSSGDMGVYGEFRHIEDLQSVGDPYDPYVLQKAALIASHIIPEEGGSLEGVLSRMGGGFQMDTEVVGVPKGSGLGTSSILAAACVKALYAF
ncbi:MAG: bifunctional fucokinase/L-fucose-1-P-guanylyltransferase, partial [Lachnospiraceae bacterium]|nr:bifunctional fucokinase/L-fucose-1-P-guanylyltransferase [Lachnospiraceae bacterium]